MNLKTLKDKIIGKWTQFKTSASGSRIIKRVKSFAWRYGVFLAITALAYFTDQILPELKLNPELIGLISYICNEITKDLNTKK